MGLTLLSRLPFIERIKQFFFHPGMSLPDCLCFLKLSSCLLLNFYFTWSVCIKALNGKRHTFTPKIKLEKANFRRPQNTVVENSGFEINLIGAH